MLNDRDENKYEAPEESEYHFSDEDVSYEVEPEATAKAAPAAQPAKENILNRLTQRRRMIISLVVFLVLVFIVYKMVAPNAQTATPSTDITAVPPVATAPSAPPPGQVTPPSTVNVPTTVATQQPLPAELRPVAPVAPAPTMQGPQVAQQQPNPAQSAPISAPSAQQMMPSQQPMVAQQMPMQVPATTMPGQTITQAPTVQGQQLPPQQPIGSPQQLPPQQAISVAPGQQIMPQQAGQAVVQTQVSYPTGTASQVIQPQLAAQLPGTVDNRITNLASENEKLVSQLQSDYNQRITEFASQNKNLQDQVQALNTRMMAMESQLNQLFQALTRQAPVKTTIVAPPPAPREAAPQPRIAYNVQAIIPGRAWLRSDSGETITVAEGDMIKNLGRVIKIDPYDGVVEINTGTRVVSLSYGSGG